MKRLMMILFVFFAFITNAQTPKKKAEEIQLSKILMDPDPQEIK